MKDKLEFTVEDWSEADVTRLRNIYEPLAESVRALVDATIRTEADAETVAEVKQDIDAAVAIAQATSPTLMASQWRPKACSSPRVGCATDLFVAAAELGGPISVEPQRSPLAGNLDY